MTDNANEDILVCCCGQLIPVSELAAYQEGM